VLPDVLQHRHPALPGQSGNRIEERIIGRRLAASLIPIIPASRHRTISARAWAPKFGFTHT